MTTWIFKAKPPYIKNRGDLYHFAVSSLMIEDKNGNVNFQNDNELWFSANYHPAGATMGSIKSYLHSRIKDKKSSFVFDVQYNSPFILTIKSYNDIDLSGLTATFYSRK